MKISINTRIKDGPWGGGNRFLQSMISALKHRGDHVVFDLNHEDIDLILIIDPRRRNPQVSFYISDIISYLSKNSRAIVVHRINECDERKNTFFMNSCLRAANRIADHTVFIASWLKNLNVWTQLNSCSVILNGASESNFPKNSASLWDQQQKMRIVTHHWGASILKGWDVYSKIDVLLSKSQWKDRIEFTYIGNVPKNIKTININVVKPLDGKQLSDELSSHHVYISASQNEPAGMHHIEGALLGLPIIYRDSGALPEYCSGYGEMFYGPRDIEDALVRMFENYSFWKTKMINYKNTDELMINNYISLFLNLIDARDEIITKRCRVELNTRLLNRILN